ncbi:hypothetical protein J5226_14420 [Lysobacter sp. K5869]|uniref:hypothetical protein n=1 Tax=Lysobacter sp. K5869 TaxID=2820808 RepID=UPI001C062F6C|nr:hypothetical protein [Lysobacter sp. K5869]QWP74856.1 hypothetical protein J5226_14420 [Lysobacter sp. K5869]
MRLPVALAALALPLCLSACDSFERALEQASKPGDTDAPAQPAPPQPALDPSQPAESRYAAQPQPAAPANAAPADIAQARGAAGKTKPFAFEPPASARNDDGPSDCAFGGLPAGTRVYAAGAYSGRKLGFQIDQSGHEATQIDVAVDDDAPVALLLGAYEPTVWNIGWSKRTRIVAVRVGGYHRQAVTGLPAGVPLRVSSYDNRGACGYFYVDATGAAKLSALAQSTFALPLTSIHIAQQGRAQIGPGNGVWITDSAAPAPQIFRIADSQLAGPAGLQHAVDAGLLRPATRADGDKWLAAQAASAPALPPVIGAPPRRMDLYNAFVVLKPMRLPAGLYGAHSATFFVPKGVSRPSGELGHSTLYDFNTLACSGVQCARE